MPGFSFIFFRRVRRTFGESCGGVGYRHNAFSLGDTKKNNLEYVFFPELSIDTNASATKHFEFKVNTTCFEKIVFSS